MVTTLFVNGGTILGAEIYCWDAYWGLAEFDAAILIKTC
jgi:hypothetical protein